MKVSPMPSINENELEEAMENGSSVTPTKGDEATHNGFYTDNDNGVGDDDEDSGDGGKNNGNGDGGGGGGGENDEGGGGNGGNPDDAHRKGDFENMDSITTVPDEREEEDEEAGEPPSEDPKSVDESGEGDGDGDGDEGKGTKTASGKLMKLENSKKLADGEEGERNGRPSSKIRIFKQRNVKMSSRNLNQVLPIEYPKEFQVIWRNINYKVKAFERTGNWSGKMVDKQILFDINGHFTSGQVTAIMGPSGAVSWFLIISTQTK